MPKIIPELRESLVAAARRRVLEDESHDLTIRQVAADCGTAVGTVYNYFPSKESLLAAVMMEDWLLCVDRMKNASRSCADPLAALEAIDAALRSFTSRYAPTWRHYSQQSGNVDQMNMRHHQVIGQIAGATEETLLQFDCLLDPNLPEILAELILLASRREDGFARIRPTLKKILF